MDNCKVMLFKCIIVKSFNKVYIILKIFNILCEFEEKIFNYESELSWKKLFLYIEFIYVNNVKRRFFMFNFLIIIDYGYL